MASRWQARGRYSVTLVVKYITQRDTRAVSSEVLIKQNSGENLRPWGPYGEYLLSTYVHIYVHVPITRWDSIFLSATFLCVSCGAPYENVCANQFKLKDSRWASLVRSLFKHCLNRWNWNCEAMSPCQRVFSFRESLKEKDMGSFFAFRIFVRV